MSAATLETGWNPHFVAYAHARGKRAHAVARGPRANADFMCWIGQQQAEFTAESGMTKETHPAVYQTEFSHWLGTKWADVAALKAES